MRNPGAASSDESKTATPIAVVVAMTMPTLIARGGRRVMRRRTPVNVSSSASRSSRGRRWRSSWAMCHTMAIGGAEYKAAALAMLVCGGADPVTAGAWQTGRRRRGGQGVSAAQGHHEHGGE